MISQHHALLRTSPKGEPFFGRCMLCGKANLRPTAVAEYCENPMRMHQDQVILEVISA
jgi:hypothetical protein